MTSHITHIWRLLKWGRILARHGALRGIERDPLTPAPVRRLVRIARLGARRFAPMFCPCPEDFMLEARFDAQVILNERITL